MDKLTLGILAHVDAGKTTLSARLARERGWSVIHLDHFFLRPEQRTSRRLERPGGNVDHERFLEEVLLPLERGEAPVYRPFDCRAQALGEPVAVRPGPVVLVEGSYSCHPALSERRMERLIAREGEDRARVFRERWIPLEERYFSAFLVEARCDYRLEL